MRGRSASQFRFGNGTREGATGASGTSDLPPGTAGREISAAGSSDGAGTVGRRRGLPNGRAVAGAFFIAVAAVIVFASWLSATRSDRKDWVVATRPLAAGTKLSASDLGTASMRLPAATAGQAFASPSALLGRVLAAPVGSGGLIQAASLVPAGQQPALRPVSVSDSGVDLASVAAGDAVDVLVTEGSDTSATTSVVVRNAQVIAVTRPSSSVVGGSSTGVVTIGVQSLAEVEAVVQASHAGSVTVVMAEQADGTGLGGGSVGGSGAGGGSVGGSPFGANGASQSGGSAVGANGASQSGVGVGGSTVGANGAG